ncbi:MAG: glycoside hydrolase family 127 protein, partial [Prevotella sp.]|nr:glycoside hydrolase family 127 protein [Prevotella sp.]
MMMLLTVESIEAQDRLYADEFPIGDVTLLDGALKKARDLNIQTLLQYDCDRLLAPYLKEAGLTPKAKAYPNWDGLDGHVGGHYLTAMAINAAATGNAECRRRMEYMISELQACADANNKNHPDWGKGYVGGMPNSERIWSTFKKGNFGTYFGSWAPFYNLHKMYAGLRDAWVYCGNEQAKMLFLGFCDWAIDLTAGLSDAQMEQMLGNEHGGMNEVLADAYAITKDKKYLDVAKRFSHRRLLTPMSQRQDNLDNMHANTQVPKVVGFERISELSGDEVYHNAANFFWDIVTGERSLAFGGNSRREHFPSKEACMDFINDIDGPETCNTNNMLKLTEDMHRRNPEARYADYYELATFN